MWFFAAARIIAGPPMSMFSMQSSNEAPFATVASNGYRFTTSRSIGLMWCCSIAARCSLFPRIASSPPCTFGCSVLTRPSIISGEPVRSATSTTERPASLSAFAVPPVETSSTLKCASSRKNGTSPALSETDSRALVIRRGWLLMADELAHQVGESVFVDRDPSTGIHSHHLKWQFRLLCPIRAGPWRRRRRMAETPAHGRRLARASVDHDLHGSPGTVGTGQEHAFLKLDCVGQGRKGPQVAIMQQKYHAASIGQPACLDRGVQMEANGEFIGGVGGERLAVGPGESVFTVKRPTVRAEPDGARVQDAAVADVSIMRCTQRWCAGFSFNAHIARA